LGTGLNPAAGLCPFDNSPEARYSLSAVPMFSPQFLEQVRAASDIVDVIGGALPLKRAGANFVTLCPFHKEKSPSFNVNPGKQIFHCFGCHKGGDVFTFVREYEGLNFSEAVVRLAERARIPVETDNSPGALQSRSLKDQLLKLHEAICVRWQQCLANEAGGQVARDYLEKRGVSPDAVKEFRIGAAPESWDDTVNWAKSKGFDFSLCEQAGLILKKEETGRHYDRFRGRLMFPICDEQGRVIAFSGRILQGDEKTAKYVNSPETLLFTKGRVLFALDKAKRAILDAGHAVICEGQLDTIACHAAGIRNVVAPQGTALTADHARMLKRYVEEVVLCFDGDKAGRNASIRSFEGLLGSGLAIRVASIPPPDDPDSWIRQHGAESFRAILGRAEGYFDFFLRHLCTENDITSDRGRLVVLRKMGTDLVKTANAVLLDTYAQKTSQRLGVSVDSVRTEFRKMRPLPSRSEPEPEPSARSGPAGGSGFEEPLPDESDAAPSVESEPLPPPPVTELWLLKYLLLSEDLTHFAAAHLDPSWVTHPTIRRIAAVHFSMGTDIPGLLAQFEGDDLARKLIAESAMEQRAIPEPEKQLADAILRLRNAAYDRRITSLTGQVSDPSLSHEERVAAMHEQQQLRAAKRGPIQPLSGE
jgi:DNA primase